MPQSGGSAAIYGILYQILGSIHWAAELRLSIAKDSEGEVESTTLVLEPAGGGGDIQVHEPTNRIVEQWKSGPADKTWSLTTLIDEVLPDLYLSVDESRLEETVEYRFVTEGRMGGWRVAHEFFGQLDTLVPVDPLVVLDDTQIRPFASGHRCTERHLLKGIAERIRSARSTRIGQEHFPATLRKLWHLLSRFTFVGGRRMEDLEEQIDHLLHACVRCRDDIVAKRRELCGVIMELAAEKEVRTSPRELLCKVGLNAESLMDLSRLHEKATDCLKRLLGFHRYRPELDVRQVPRWPNGESVLVLAGESGQGKTWRLGAMARAVCRPGSFVVILSATGDADQDLLHAGEMIWQQVLGHDSAAPLNELPARIRKFHPTIPDPYVVVLVDNVLHTDEARLLVEHAWLQSGVRVGMTTTPGIGRAIHKRYGDRVHLEPVGDFTAPEIRKCLDLSGFDWTALPVRVQNILWRPLLVGIYCDLAGKTGWQPTVEYQIYEGVWSRIADAGRGPDLPNALVRLGALCLSVTEPGAVYPWTQSSVLAAGIDNEIQRHLESVSWLSRTGDGRIEIWHDRLLSWGVAEGLVELLRGNQLTFHALVERIRRIGKSTRGQLSPEHALGDVLWILSDQESPMTYIVDLLKAFEGNYPDPLYRELLPRLGSRVIGSLEHRLRAVTDRDVYPVPRLTASAMVRIGAHEKDEVVRAAMQWVSYDRSELQETALLVLAQIPAGQDAVLDRLWELHCQARVALDAGRTAERIWRSRATARAITACVRVNPSWLEKKIVEFDASSEPFQQLAFLLASLPSSDGADIWSRNKRRLLSHHSDDDIRALCRCIRRYRDRAEIERLRAWVGHEDGFAAGSAIGALACIDPSIAIESLAALDRGVLRLFTSWWLPELLLRKPDDTRRALLHHLGTDPGGCLILAETYRHNPEEMDDQTLDVLLDTLGLLVDERLLGNLKERDPRLSTLLGTLKKVCRIDQLKQCWNRAGTPFEGKLVKAALALARVGPGGWQEAQEVAQIVFKIAGPGLTQLVNTWLQERQVQALELGVRWALVKPDAQTRKLLIHLARERVSEDTPRAAPVREAVLCALASFGEYDEVGLSILEYPSGYSAELARVLGGRPPFSEEIIARAIEALQADEARTRIGGYRVIRLSGRVDLVPYLHDAVDRVHPAGSEANVLTTVLRELKASDAKSIEYLISEMRVPKHLDDALHALLQIETEPALKAAKGYLGGPGGSRLHPDTRLRYWEYVWTTARDEAVRSSVSKDVWSLIQRAAGVSLSGTTMKVLGDLDDPAAREFLVTQALQDPRVDSDTQRISAAIRSLARTDSDIGFRMARRALGQGWKDPAPLPQVLVDIDADRAIDFFCEHIPGENHTQARWAIGRALRGVADRVTIDDRLARMTQSTDPAVRAAAAELAGWFRSRVLDEALSSIATDDDDQRVRQAAQKSLRCRAKLEEVIRLMESFDKTTGARRWVLLDAILHVADPHLLQDDPGHEIELTKFLGEESDVMWSYAEECLEHRFKKLEDNAQRADKERNAWD